MIDAIVIFEGDNTHPLSFLLSRGFRHVWCAVIDERRNAWVGHNLKVTGYETNCLAPADYDLAAFYEAEGYTVIRLTQPRRRVPGWLAVASCVGVTKTVLGIRSRALTPRQLYRHLTRTNVGAAA